jgi:hypothetical protein
VSDRFPGPPLGPYIPDPGQLADSTDELGWGHDTFADHARPDNAVPTVAAADYLQGV